ncbi:hypothetical protein B0H34DRAFT_796419 [Crassisporium funariophilum]|nr:hypothetical protein B0H34DRAFT_796419 [Crassisporium funariophilum]
MNNPDFPSRAHSFTKHPISETSTIIDGAEMPRESQTKVGRIILSIISGGVPMTPQRAMVPLPTSYEEAVSLAIELLGTYLDDPKPESVVLKIGTPSKRETFVWADVAPRHWAQVVNPDDEIGVFPIHMDEPSFLHGAVMMRVALKMASGPVNEMWLVAAEHKDGGGHGYFNMSRPRNFQEAVSLVKQLNFPKGLRPPAVEGTPDRFRFGVDAHGLDGTLPGWREIPPRAYSDEAVWRKHVPLPGKSFRVILG